MKHKIFIAQINPTVGDLSGNHNKILAEIKTAKNKHADIIVFPEQVVTGYPAQDLLLHSDFVKDTMRVNEDIAANALGITVILGSIETAPAGHNGKNLYNTALVMRAGRIIARQAKTLLPNYDVFHELRYFTSALNVEPIELDGVKYGIQICEDMWDEDYSRKITKELVKKGAKIIINLSASPHFVGKKEIRRRIIKAHVLENEVDFIFVNMVGGQDELIFDGGSMALRKDGKLVTELSQFKEELKLVDFSTEIKANILRKEEEIFTGLSLGVHDFVRKNNLKTAVLGLSGGIDSAMCAAILVEALGKENVVGLALPSEFNSSHAYTDAKNLAQNLGITFDCVPIKGMYNSVLSEMSRVFENKKFDVTEENIQARLRMLVLMAYANKHGNLLIATGDKSEIALGYTTLYGDMSGAFSIISDLTKPEVYELARWYNEHKKSEIISKGTLTKPPSPELRKEQLAPFDYGRISPLLEQMTARKSFSKLKDNFSREDLKDSYSKFRRNEFKRFQAPLALKCKPVSFGIGRLYPLTNKYVPFELNETEKLPFVSSDRTCVSNPALEQTCHL